MAAPLRLQIDGAESRLALDQTPGSPTYGQFLPQIAVSRTVTWQDRNHRALIRALDRVYGAITREPEGAGAAPPHRGGPRRRGGSAARARPRSSGSACSA